MHPVIKVKVLICNRDKLQVLTNKEEQISGMYSDGHIVVSRHVDSFLSHHGHVLLLFDLVRCVFGSVQYLPTYLFVCNIESLQAWQF